MTRKLAIGILSACATAIASLAAFAAFGPSYAVWRLIPAARAWRAQEILADSSLIGLNHSGVRARLREPDAVHGPYSWWSLGDLPPDAELSALVFRYDDALNIAKVWVRETRSPETKPLPLDLDQYRHSDRETRHRMHLALAELSKKGKLPHELRTIDDVERFFPRARFVSQWRYETAGFAVGTVVVSFNRDRVVDEVYEDW